MVTMREKPYEEILAEQRRKQLEYLDKPKEPKKVDKKKKIKKPKSIDVRDNGERGEMTHEEGENKLKEKLAKRVELELDAMVAPNVATLPVTDKKIKGTPKNPSKSIILNKEERNPVQSTGEANELIHRRNVSKDELELKHKHDAQLLKPEADSSTGPTGLRKFEIVRTDKKDTDQTETHKSNKKEGGKKASTTKDVGHEEIVSESFEKVASVTKLMSAPPPSPPVEQTPKSNRKAKNFSASESGSYFIM